MYSLGRDDVLFLFLVESGRTLDAHIIGLCRARCENDIFWIGTNEIRNVLS